LSKLKEVTIEANPEDLTEEKIALLSALPFNRLSIGVQSLNKEMLDYLGRVHDPIKTIQAVRQVQSQWTKNISVDLIYGVPGMTDDIWRQTIDEVLKMEVPHISCYALTVEPATSLPKLIERGRKKAPVEEEVLRQMDLLVDALSLAGYRQYEISNFSLPGREALHNANYWKQKPYVGFGPSAHSFNGISRQWNVANNIHYIRSLSEGKCNFEKELLSKEDRFNEYLMTGLRTISGVDGEYIKLLYGLDFFEHFILAAARFIKNGWIEEVGCYYRLTLEGVKVSDYIIAELFITE